MAAVDEVARRGFSSGVDSPRLAGKDFDPVTFDILMVKAGDFASQITIEDLPVFRSIAPEVRRPSFKRSMRV